MLARLPELEDESHPVEIELDVDGLRCICPFNGVEDRFDAVVTYVPLGGRVLELAKFRRYLDGFAGHRVSHEALTRHVLEDVLETIQPAYCRIETTWAPVEGVACVVRAVAGA